MAGLGLVNRPVESDRKDTARTCRNLRIVYSGRVILAQSLGEYAGGSGLIGSLAAAFESAAQWVEFSVRENTVAWMAAGVGLLFVLWLFRGR